MTKETIGLDIFKPLKNYGKKLITIKSRSPSRKRQPIQPNQMNILQSNTLKKDNLCFHDQPRVQEKQPVQNQL